MSTFNYDKYLADFVDEVQTAGTDFENSLRQWRLNCPEDYRDEFTQDAAVVGALSKFGEEISWGDDAEALPSSVSLLESVAGKEKSFLAATSPPPGSVFVKRRDK